jgi:hypothetical protein
MVLVMSLVCFMEEEEGEDLRFEEGVHLVCPVDLHMSHIWALSWELYGEVFERVVLRHGEKGVWCMDVELHAAVEEVVDGRDPTSGFTSADYRRNG